MKKMKKILVAVLAVTMMFAAVGCGKSGDASESSASKTYADAVAALTAVWDGMNQEFPAMGGGFENPVDNAPGAIATTDTDMMSYTLLVPADVQEKVTDVANLVHMMNANTFTGVGLKLDGMDAETAAASIKDNFKGNQFMCGMPDKIVVVAVDGYVVYAYGEAGIVDDFKAKAEALDGAKVLVDENYA